MTKAMRVAMVTGAGSGIGRAVALGLQQDGFALVLAGRRAAALEETRTLAGEAGASVLAIPADVTDPASVDALFARTRDAFGRLDVLFNNAGATMPGMPLEDVPLERWRAVVDVNLTGTFLCTQRALRLMKAQQPPGGRIINNGSLAAQVPRPQSVAYAATKHGITGLTKATALEGRAFGIACGQIDIGNAVTEMTEKFVTGVLQPDGRVASEARFDVAHVVSAVRYMASLPLDTNVLSLTVMATGMPFVGRG